MAIPGVQITKDDLPKLRAAIETLTGSRVMVGVPAEAALRQPEPGEPSTVNNAMLAYIQENGLSEMGIPARPFLKPTVESLRSQIAERFKTLALNALRGSPDAAQKGLHALGLFVSTAVKLKINTGPCQPLAERTLAARRARGRLGTKPLIDTGQLRNAITYVVKKIRRIGA
jgi:hypothetical protein